MQFSIFLEKFKNIVNPELSGRNLHIQGMKNYSNRLITELISSEKPFFAGRFGAYELGVLVNLKDIRINERKNILAYLRGGETRWWLNKGILNKFKSNAGFFPIEEKSLFEYYDLCRADMKEIDLLGSWLHQEKYFLNELLKTKRVLLEDLDPFFADKPWTMALEGKKVLVVYPFVDEIRNQYSKRDILFENQLLPQFDLKVYKPFSLNEAEARFETWFDSLNYMIDEIKELEFDVALIGAGAYGMNLGAELKRYGKQVIHLGGATQLLFGIIGNRWVENPILNYPIHNLVNDNWVSPYSSSRPKNFKEIEDGCYW